MGMLPQFTATRALAPFGAVGRPQPSPNVVAWGNAKACNDNELAACQTVVYSNFSRCSWLINSTCAADCPFGNTNSPGCQACLARERAACSATYIAEMQACTDEHGCPSGLRCLRDEARPTGDPVGTCCDPRQIACAAKCLPSCDPPHRFDPSSCTCSCPPVLCPPHKPLNQATCQCECPTAPCPDYRMTRNPDTCECICPPEVPTDCHGYCVNLQNDPLFCGSCDAEPCDAFEELCCNGRCTNICSDANCGSCGRAIQPGEKCCRPQCTPTRLGTNSNCADCGNVCVGGRTCTGATGGVGGSCQCPAGSRDCCLNPPCVNPCCPDGRACCGGQCCPEGYRCCDGHCCPNVADCCNGQCCPAGAPTCCGVTCVDTGSNVQHCGACNNQCRGGQICFNNVCTPYSTECRNGQCVCPNGTYLCLGNWCCPNNFPVCCPANSLFVGQYGCPAGTTCCNAAQTMSGFPGCCP
jgi:hypothetical protein